MKTWHTSNNKLPFYAVLQQVKGSSYVTEYAPPNWTPEANYSLEKEHRMLPEEFDTQTRLPVITPDHALDLL